MAKLVNCPKCQSAEVRQVAISIPHRAKRSPVAVTPVEPPAVKTVTFLCRACGHRWQKTRTI